MFIANAIRNRYFEMFRKNKGKMLEESFNEVLLDTMESKDIYCYHNVEFLIDLNRMICLENGSKAKMIDYILQEQKSDREIAIQLNVSRQYVNRCKKEIFQKLLEYHQNG